MNIVIHEAVSGASRTNPVIGSSAAPAASTAASAVVPLSNVEAQWEKLTQQEQLAVHQQLEEIQKRDWKTLSLDEKKAGASRSRALAYCVRKTDHTIPYSPVHWRGIRRRSQ